ncbi:MAG: chlorosome envelope protein B [Chlorobiaceae bacterium]|jgi:chlorosome envelope protein B|nr:chlorosome envelope protein B [Chlorobiaceae bacterium]NTV16257.1 chlorosome envelope protein B [Chlorobiaceae bacterium]
MSNESINDFSVALNNLLKTVGTLAQQQIELLNIGIKAAGQVIEPLVKTSSDLLGNVLNTVGQVVQNITSALAPKK